MSDYVEVGKILEFLDAEINALNSTFGEIGGEAGAYVECFKDVRSYIERFPTADVAPINWISVKDKLPDAEVEVLAVCIRNGYRFICPVIYEDGTMLTQNSIWNWYELDSYGTYSEENDDYYIPAGWWENRQFTPDDVYNNPVDCSVTHWMLLPAVPKETGK